MIWLVLSYISFGLFAAGTLYKVISIAKMPTHLRWELAPVPGEKSKSAHGGSYLEDYEWWNNPRETSVAGQIKVMAEEIFMFRGVWRNNRPLWPFTFAFHIAVYVLIASVSFLIAAFLMEEVAGVDGLSSFLMTAASFAGIGGYLLGSFGAVGLIVMRAARRHWRQYSSLSTYFNLLVLSAVFVSGFVMCCSVDDFIRVSYEIVTCLMTASPIVSITPSSYWHLGTILFFIAYIPFSFMIHFVIKYFTYHDIRWDDAPMDEKSGRKIGELLKQPVTWAAPHVSGEKHNSWVETVTTENSDEAQH